MTVTVKISKYEALDMLVNRVKYWSQDRVTVELFEKMYQNYIDTDMFHNCEFNVSVIVDNDYVNYTSTIDESDKNFKKILDLHKDGYRDISCENVDYSFVEAVSDD